MALLQHILSRDNGRCRYCGSRTYGEAKLDHVVPHELGGRTVVDNLVSACEQCLERKSGRTLEEAGMLLLEVLA